MQLLLAAIEVADVGSGVSPWAWLGPQLTLAIGSILLCGAVWKVKTSECDKEIARAEKREAEYRLRIDKQLEQNTAQLELLQRSVAAMEAFADELRDRRRGH